MTTNTEIANALIAAWEARDVAAAARLLSNDFVLTGPSPEALNRDAFLGFQAIHNEAFPDWKFNVSKTETQGDTVTFTYRIHATHTGPFDVAKLGVPIPAVQPTGMSRDWPVEHMTLTIQNGKVSKLYVEAVPGAGVVGTLEWLGIRIQAPAF